MKALITGASSGIGKDIAIELGKRNIDLVLVARNKEKLEETKKLINSNVEIISMDISNEQNCRNLYEKVKDIDILVNNAGFGAFGKFSETDLSHELNMINTNVCAPHILTKLYLQDMIKKNSGYILNVASIAGFLPGPLMATYYATKAYLLRLTQGISEEIKKDKLNIKISCLCPGPTKTKFLEKAGVNFKTKSAESSYVAKCAVKGMLKGKEIILPELKIKCARVLCKIVPDKILAKVAYRIQESRK